MKLKIEIRMDNAAFGENPQEVKQIITEQLFDRVDGYSLKPGYWQNLMDSNGNHVGEAKVSR